MAQAGHSRTTWHVEPDRRRYVIREMAPHYTGAGEVIARGIMFREQANLMASAQEMLEALKPFARFRECQRALGGTTPRTGTLYSVDTVNGAAEITVEHLEAALAALSKAEGK